MHKLVSALSLASAIAVAAFALATPTVAKAHRLQAPCDFIISGGGVAAVVDEDASASAPMAPARCP